MYAARCMSWLASSLVVNPSWGMIARSWAFWCPFEKLTTSSLALPPGYITAHNALNSLRHAHTCMLSTCMQAYTDSPGYQGSALEDYKLDFRTSSCHLFSVHLYFFWNYTQMTAKGRTKSCDLFICAAWSYPFDPFWHHWLIVILIPLSMLDE